MSYATPDDTIIRDGLPAQRAVTMPVVVPVPLQLNPSTLWSKRQRVEGGGIKIMPYPVPSSIQLLAPNNNANEQAWSDTIPPFIPPIEAYNSEPFIQSLTVDHPGGVFPEKRLYSYGVVESEIPKISELMERSENMLPAWSGTPGQEMKHFQRQPRDQFIDGGDMYQSMAGLAEVPNPIGSGAAAFESDAAAAVEKASTGEESAFTLSKMFEFAKEIFMAKFQAKLFKATPRDTGQRSAVARLRPKGFLKRTPKRKRRRRRKAKPFYKQTWFWPVAIGSAVIIGGIVLAKK